VTSSFNIKPTPFGQKYVLLNHIKSGGMAAVWLGKMSVLSGDERLVAIKRILPHVAEDSEFISMFIDEAKITVQLSHPNICKIYELGQDLDAHSYYIVMEYVHGRDLRALFDWCAQTSTPPPIPVACYIMACCCDGLNYAHCRKDSQGNEMHIVHRDVSLQNILVSFDGDVKIIDFGIARAANRSTQTAAGTLKGKFSYMSPEQISGPAEKVDRRSDVFGIGICLYEMLTGKRLFSGKTDFSVLEKVRKAEVALPTTLNKDIPPVLEKIVMKALAREVEERYQYASEVGDDLWHFLYSLDGMFDRRSLAEYMQTSFAQEYADEKTHLQECLATPAFTEPSGKYPVLAEQTAEQLAQSEQRAQEALLQSESPNIDSTILVDASALLGGAKVPPGLVLTEQLSASALPPGPGEGVSMDASQGRLSATPTPISSSGLSETPYERSRLLSSTASMVVPRASAGKASPSTWTSERAAVPTNLSFGSMLKKYLWVWAVSLLAILVAVVVLVWPTPMGNVLVEMPEELAGGKAQLFINDKEMLDKNGGPIQTWPRLFQVPAGRARISISAEGYEPLVVDMVVPKGSSYVRLPQRLQKK